MKKKILIIGKHSFIGSNLFDFFKNKKLNVYISSNQNFLNNYKKKYYNFDFIINCSSNKEFVEKHLGDKKEFYELYINSSHRTNGDNHLKIFMGLLTGEIKDFQDRDDYMYEHFQLSLDECLEEYEDISLDYHESFKELSWTM